jgi:hypothetical protein
MYTLKYYQHKCAENSQRYLQLSSSIDITDFNSLVSMHTGLRQRKKVSFKALFHEIEMAYMFRSVTAGAGPGR